MLSNLFASWCALYETLSRVSFAADTGDGIELLFLLWWIVC